MGVLGGGQVDWSQAGLEEKISADREGQGQDGKIEMEKKETYLHVPLPPLSTSRSLPHGS